VTNRRGGRGVFVAGEGDGVFEVFASMTGPPRGCPPPDARRRGWISARVRL